MKKTKDDALHSGITTTTAQAVIDLAANAVAPAEYNAAKLLLKNA